MKNLLFILTAITLFSCASEEKVSVNPFGEFVIDLKISDSIYLPVEMKITEDRILIINAQEIIDCKNIYVSKDSIYGEFPVFNSYISGRFNSGAWEGYYHDPHRKEDYSISFTSRQGNKFEFENSSFQIKEEYKVLFSNGTENEYPALGLFEQNGNVINGTFRTETGDYRFLSGNVGLKEGKTVFALSCLDGSHAFLFNGEVTGEKIKGNFYSGNHWSTSFVGSIDENFELSDPDTLTKYNEAYGDFDFSFPDLNGDTVVFSEKYKGDVALIQIMGSWCPNCMDETRYLSGYYELFKDKGVNVIALAFERTEDFEKSRNAVQTLKQDVGAEYDFLIAGTSNKTKASDKLPMLSNILSFPTTLLINKSGKVVYIHTGFNGPSTGEEFESFKKYLEGFTYELLNPSKGEGQ